MTLLSIAVAIREAWDALFVSRHTLWLEAENTRLRAQVAKLEIDLKDVRLPIQAAPANKEDLSKVPQKTGGFQFWDADIRTTKRKEIFANELEAPQETANV
jgi:hypothetical protein